MLSISTRKLGIIATSVIVAFALLLAQGSVFAATMVVSGDTAAGENQPGWLFNRDVTTATPYEFNTDAASIGSGSLYVLPIGANPSDKFIAENFINTAIADIDSFSYDFQIGSDGEESDANQFYLNVYANFGESADDKFYDCRYNVVPTTGATTTFSTVTFDPTLAYPVTTSGSSPFACPAVPADMDSLSSTSTVRAFAINVGDTSVNDEGVSGYLDNVVAVINGESTVYDFDPAVPPPAVPATKDDCKNGGWMTFTDPGFKNQGECVSSVAKTQ